MIKPRRILWFAVFAAAVLLLPCRAAAQSGTVTDDAFLSSNSTTQALNLNGQGIALVVAGSSATVGPLHVGLTKTYIKFQLQSSLPSTVAAANVAKATLKLFISPSCNPSGAIDIYPVTSAWAESTLNASSPPAVASAAFATGIAVGKANSFLVVDVTSLVQEWLNGSANGGLDNDGIELVADTSTTNVIFDSKESFITSHEPRLEIVLVHSGPAGAAATIQVGTTTTLGAGGQAAVTNSGTPNAAILNFSIPQGQTGATGQTGAAGAAATVQVGTTITVPPGTPASVLNGGTSSAAMLDFLIPQGPSGLTGSQGPQGPIGINNRGSWIGGNAYNPSDAVSYNNSFWMATAADNGSQPPAANPNWQLLAAGINNRGVWSSANSYSVNDAVTDGGSYWLAIAATTATSATSSTSCEPSAPPSPCSADWQLLAAAGAQGAQGLAGAQGLQGIQGPMGFIGPQGPPGPVPTGAALTTTSNTFTGSQTINGNLILSGTGAAIQFPDGTTQATAVTASTFQSRVSGTCPNGTSIVAISSDGSVVCSQPVFAPTGITSTQVLELGGATFGPTAIAIGSDGLPIVAFRRVDVGAGISYIMFLHCGNFTCTNGNTTAILNQLTFPDETGASLSLTVGSDGLPVISFERFASSFEGVLLLHCRDLLCNSADLPKGFLGRGPTSITIGSNGNPIFSFADVSNNFDLILCNSPTCSTYTLVSKPVTGPNFTLVVPDSLALLRPQNYPMASASGAFFYCVDTSCSVSNVPSVSSLAEIGASSLISGSDGLPIMTFAEGSSGLVVLHCAITSCEDLALLRNKRTVLDTSYVKSSSIFIGPQNLPIIAYAAVPPPGSVGPGPNSVNFINCGDISCASGNEISPILTLNLANEVMSSVSLALGVDGLPIMSFSAGSSVYVTHCFDANCSPPNIVRR
jgi:hypothetical protein